MRLLPIRPGLLALLALATIGCGVTTTTTSTSCTQLNDCDVSLSGNGADVDFNALALTIELDDTGGDKAKLKVGLLMSSSGDTIELAEGESRRVRSALITLEDVDGAKVKLRVRPG